MVTVPIEPALRWHTCHICKTAWSSPAAQRGEAAAAGSQHLLSSEHSGVAVRSCSRSAHRGGTFSELLLSPAPGHHISGAEEGLRAEQLWGAGLQGKAPLFGLPAGSGITYNLARHLKAAPVNKAHVFSWGKRERYWVEAKLQSHLCVLWQLRSCVLCACLHTSISKGHQKTERRYLLFSMRWVTGLNKITWPESYGSVGIITSRMEGGVTITWPLH